jgi:hypothetical protein
MSQKGSEKMLIHNVFGNQRSVSLNIWRAEMILLLIFDGRYITAALVGFKESQRRAISIEVCERHFGLKARSI